MTNLKKILRGTFIHKLYWKCWHYSYNYRQQMKISKFQKDGLCMLRAFAEALNNEGIVFWLDFGTLLGYYREHSFIRHDNDLDFGAYIEDAQRIKNALEKNGFELVRNYWVEGEDGIEHCFKYRASTVDVFYYTKKGNELVGCSFLPIDGVQLNKTIRFRVMEFVQPYTGLKRDEFLGVNVNVPVDTDLYLRSNYGSGYMTPDPNFNSEKTAPNITIYDYAEKRGAGILKMKYS